MAERIAIVGLGGLFPGSANLQEFWQLVAEARDAGKPVTGDRWFLTPEKGHRPGGPSPDAAYSRWACLIENFQFDPSGLSLDPAFVRDLDPVFSFGLHAARMAWNDAQTAQLDRRRVGVILGNIALPYESTSAAARDVLVKSVATQLHVSSDTDWPDSPWSPWNRYVTGLPAGVIAQALELGGNSWTLDAACASSLYAIKFACDELQAGRADAMLAGGLCRPDCQYTQFGFAQLQALTKGDRCRPLSAAADGLVVGEGAGIFVLKRLSDALAHGDHIYGVIAGVGLSNDRGANLLAPHSEGQLRAMQAAYRQAGWSPSDVDLVECHATGTPVGDQIELESLHTLWRDVTRSGPRCVLSAVKSNVGHLLTGAGAAGVTKLLLAMQHETLPPTANWTEPAKPLQQPDSPFEVLTAAQAWSRRHPAMPRRCAMNAFGFGGINAHLLLEEWLPGEAAVGNVSQRRRESLPWASADRVSSTPSTSTEIAIVGVAARFGAAKTWPEVRKALLSGQTDQLAMDSVEIPVGEFRIPPAEVADMLPQQQVMLQVAAAALENAGLSRELGDRAGVFIGLELDPRTTNFHARWSLDAYLDDWAEKLGWDLSPEDRQRWLTELRDDVSPPLNATRVMGNLGGIVASRLAREFDLGGPSFTISSGESSGLRALQVAMAALQRGELDVAIVGGVDLTNDPRTARAMQQLGEQRPQADLAAAIILKRHDGTTQSGPSPQVLLSLTNPPQTTESDARGLVLTAHRYSAGAGSELLTLLQGLAALQTSVKPADGNRPVQPWLRDRQRGPRWVDVVSADPYSPAPRVRLAEGAQPADLPVEPVLPISTGLFVTTAATREGLVERLGELRQLAQPREPMSRLASRWFHTRPPVATDPFVITFVADDSAELQSQLETALAKGRGQALSSSSTSRRSTVYGLEEPLGPTGRLAYVFPGSGNAFPGMGRELLAVFPQILQQQDAENGELRQQYRPDLHWSGQTVLDHKAMIFGQVALGTALCDLLAAFGLRPQASLGYSLGESAAFFGLRAWRDRDGMLERMRHSPLFGSDLVEPFDAARAAWKIPAGQDVPWWSGLIDRNAEAIRAVLPKYPRAHLLIVNTDRQCVIGGDKEQVKALVRELSANFLPLLAPSTVHCPVLKTVEPAYDALHRMWTSPPVGVDVYSTAWGKRYELTRDSAAKAIVAQAVDTIEFPQVIRQAWADGVRVFVEIGPGNSCTKMIGEILAERPHLAVAACPATQTPVRAFLDMLAQLIAHGVDVSLAPLFADAATPREDRALIRTPIAVPLPTPRRIPDRKVSRRAVTASVAPTVPASIPLAASSLRSNVPPVSTVSRRAPQSADDPLSVSDSLPMTTTTPDLPDSALAILQQTLAARAEAHGAYLSLNERLRHLLVQVVETETGAVEQAGMAQRETMFPAVTPTEVAEKTFQTARPVTPPRSLSREQCLEFAIGRIGDVLGEKFAGVDAYPTRVRLPDEPLMLVDRILTIEGEPLSMTHGRVVTEHDIHPGAWYLDCDRIPTCIAVESGQADLFLSGWLGIDFQTKGLACYRLLDAVVTFHDGLPRPGETIHYDIRINHFFRQGETWLFRFEFDATVNGRPILTMREGCAGFFSNEELAAGKGVIHTALDKQPRPGKLPKGWRENVSLARESYDDSQILSLRNGDLVACFGPQFQGLPVQQPVTLPFGRMELVDRVLSLEPGAGKYGLGKIVAEMDIRPDAWFLTCHFCDDQVMPGTLMYECCLHTLRIYLLRMGWIGETGQIAYEPVPGVRSRLKCRGQVLATTQKVWYEITIKELGYRDSTATYQPTDHPQEHGTPYCLADALMYADGKPIVEITDMSVQLTGLTREQLTNLWGDRQSVSATTPALKKPLFDTASITQFAIGKPSLAFGDRYRIFDEGRVIARLPGPPFQFLDRITRIENCQPWVLKAGGVIDAEYDIPRDAWYFAASRQPVMPFAVLLETALQPCGWLAGYLGSALTSESDLSFRNLGGEATQFRPVTADMTTLTTTVKMTRVSQSGGMIIQHYDYDLRHAGEPIYQGNTYFGFFSKAALANQVGIREAVPYQPTADELQRAESFPVPTEPPFANDQWRMVRTIAAFVPDGGPNRLGFICGTIPVDPSAWFFKAHFYQDPVWPGSLGLESFLQLLQVYGVRRWGLSSGHRQMASGLAPQPHRWVYRGQVIPQDRQVTVEAVIKSVDDDHQTLVADGFLIVDGRIIYQMIDFPWQLLPLG